MEYKNDILNKGLDFALEFGENWLQPIQKRLSKKYPELTKKELDDYNTACGTAMREGHDFVYNRLTEIENLSQTISKQKLFDAFKKFMTNKYSWINEENLVSVFSQGCYYAYKDGLTKITD